MRRLPSAMFAALAAAAAGCATDVVVEDGANPVVVTELDQVYADAAAETGVPADLLKAIGYVQTRWQHVVGEAEFDDVAPRTGVMALTPSDLERGAALTGFAAEDVAESAEANILAAAKLLAAEAAAQGISGSDLTAWEPAVATWAGLIDDDSRRDFVRGDLYRTLTAGVEERAEGGELIASIPAHPELATLIARPLYAAGPDYAAAVWRASPNYSSRPTGITHVIIHTCEGGYSGCVSTLINGSVSAHYVVNESGSQITQLVRETNKAWHVGATYECSRNGNTDCAKNGQGVNNFSIGIEHAGYGSQASWSAGLIAASAKLTCDITRDRNIPRDRFHIVGHGQLQPYNRTDPGRNWPWADYIERVRSECGGGGTPTEPPAAAARHRAHHRLEQRQQQRRPGQDGRPGLDLVGPRPPATTAPATGTPTPAPVPARPSASTCRPRAPRPSRPGGPPAPTATPPPPSSPPTPAAPRSGGPRSTSRPTVSAGSPSAPTTSAPAGTRSSWRAPAPPARSSSPTRSGSVATDVPPHAAAAVGRRFAVSDRRWRGTATTDLVILDADGNPGPDPRALRADHADRRGRHGRGLPGPAARAQGLREAGGGEDRPPAAGLQAVPGRGAPRGGPHRPPRSGTRTSSISTTWARRTARTSSRWSTSRASR
jgi:N-acetyl-anhydromuramyl-L-alanine amidase AmpD